MGTPSFYVFIIEIYLTNNIRLINCRRKRTLLLTHNEGIIHKKKYFWPNRQAAAGKKLKCAQFFFCKLKDQESMSCLHLTKVLILVDDALPTTMVFLMAFRQSFPSHPVLSTLFKSFI